MEENDMRNSDDRLLTVAVLTYRRPDDLRVVLPALVEQARDAEGEGLRVEVLVVDNDPDGSGAAIVRDVDPRVRYVQEPTPGIAAARNRALDEAAESDVLVFIDDDERPHAAWLTELIRTQLRTGADAVVGWVVPAFDGPLDPWVEAGGFLLRRRVPTGTSVAAAATNNLLLDMGFVRSAGLRFDDRFGLSGGSDTLFTRQLTDRGGLMVSCAEAVVTDQVPAQRMTRQWVVRRALRSGNSAGRVEIELAAAPPARMLARARVATQGLVRTLGGVARWSAGVVVRSPRHSACGLRTAARGAGMLWAAAGVAYQEYRREPRSPRRESRIASR
jgi:succinoglycan biosynthesis protein ExoM